MAKTQADKAKELDKFKKTLKSKSEAELRKMEDAIIKEADKVDKEVSDTTFDLPTENYEVVAEAVRYFLDNRTVQWQYTLAMVGMYDFWNPEKHPGKIPYAHLDSILRTLGELQFTGYKEWSMVVALNKYFEPLHNAYVATTDKVYEVASRHSAIIDELQLKTPVESPEK